MIKLSILANLRENQNIAHCSVCSVKTHCRFSHAYISPRLHSTESKFHSFLSQNLPNNMGDICMILIQNGCRFITHSPTISSIFYVFYDVLCFCSLTNKSVSTNLNSLLPILNSDTYNY